MSGTRKSPPIPRAQRELVRALLRWFAGNARNLPWRRTLDPYAIWISEIMLQQTQVRTVVPYFERWMRALPDIRSLAAARPQRVLKLWEGLGYYSRARNLQSAARQIVREHAGRFPDDSDAIDALPGIGRYTAGAIASIAFNQPRPILDGNVVRVLCRVFGIRDNPREGRTNERLWQLSGQLVRAAAAAAITATEANARRAAPNANLLFSGRCSALNQALMELGATTCTPRSPACAICPWRTRCVARRDGMIDQIPNLKRRAKPVSRRFVAFVLAHRGRVLVRQRPAGGINGALWEFPNVELNGESRSDLRQVAAETTGVTVGELVSLCAFKHSITTSRITLAAYASALEERPASSAGQAIWKPVSSLRQLAFTGAHGKILRAWESEDRARRAAVNESEPSHRVG